LGDSEWAVAPGSEEPEDERTLPAFLAGVLAGLVALGLIWAGAALVTGRGPDPRAGADRGAVDAAASTSPAAEAVPEPSGEDETASPVTPTDRCRRADAELAAPLHAAVPGLDRWEIHVGAMNKLVAGEITLAQATAFWTQTRVGARRSLDHFYSVARRVPSTKPDCPAPDSVARASAELRACVRHVVREQEALDTAGTAMGTWRNHVHDMEMLRRGDLSPTVATQMWLANWQRGVRELGAYRGAAQAVDRARPC
jgi:hypothetical protein